MQNTKFNQELKQYAKGYTVNPSGSAFDKVMQKRESEKRRKRLLFFWVAAASVIGIAALMYVSLFLDKSVLTEPTTLASTNRYQKPPNISVPIQHQESDLNKPNKQQETVSSYVSPIKSKEIVNASRENNIYSTAKVNKKPTILPSINRSTNEGRVHTNLDNSTIINKGNTVLATKTKSNIIPEKIMVESSEITSVSDSETKDNTKAENAAPINDNKQTVALPLQTALTADKKEVANNNSISDTISTANSIIQNIKSDSLLQSANNPVPKPIAYKWSISALFTPQFINSVYSANSSADLAWFNNYYDNKKRNDQSRFSYNTGVKIEHKLNKRLSLSSGVLLSVVKFEELSLKVDSTVIQHSGLVVGTTTTITTYDRNRFDISFTSLEFPLLVNYNIQRNKLSYQLNAGLSYSYLIATRSLVFNNADTLYAKETNDAKNSRLQQHHLILICGANIAYNITTNWSMYAGPVFRYQLNSLYSKDYVIRQNPYYAGLEVGVKYSF